MSAKLISTIYFYLISAIAIVLLIIGVYNAVNLAVNLTQYEEYPLRYGGAERCLSTPMAVDQTTTSDGSLTIETKQVNQQEQCIASLAVERRDHKIDDIKNTIAFTLIGTILFAIHFPIALRRSNEGK